VWKSFTVFLIICTYSTLCFSVLQVRKSFAKFAYGGLVWVEPIFDTDPAASNKEASLKSGQKWQKLVISIC